MKTPDNFILEAIKDGVQQKVEIAFEESKNRLIERLEKEKDIIVSGVVLNVMRKVDMADYRDNIIITINKIDK